MKILKVTLFLIALLGFSLAARSQNNAVTVDYTHPQKYVVGGVKVKGNVYFSEDQIRQQSGLNPGMTVTVPGEDISNIVNRL
ncbi:MAG: hypothetical protein MJY56_01685 [Bacteroidales bacterium]|nr:hypothetical protein [Bacteroidales bacterium]